MHFLKSRIASFGYAFSGLGFVLRTQHNARIHFFVALCVLGLGWIADLGTHEWLWLLLAITLVWFAETMNTAFEYLCDVVQPEFHASVGKAKDIAAGAVLLTALFAIVVGAVILVPALLG